MIDQKRGETQNKNEFSFTSILKKIFYKDVKFESLARILKKDSVIYKPVSFKKEYFLVLDDYIQKQNLEGIELDFTDKGMVDLALIMDKEHEIVYEKVIEVQKILDFFGENDFLAEELLRKLWNKHVLRKDNVQLLLYTVQNMVESKQYLEPEKMICLVKFRNFVEFYDNDVIEPYVLREIPKKRPNNDEIIKFENKLKTMFSSMEFRKEPCLSADWIKQLKIKK